MYFQIPTVHNCSDKTDLKVYPTLMFKWKDDPRSPINLVKLLQKNVCRNFLFVEKYYPIIYEENSTSKNNPIDLNGLACKSNMSLALSAMDSLRNYPFVEKLGINVSKFKYNTADVVIDDKRNHIIY